MTERCDNGLFLVRPRMDLENRKTKKNKEKMMELLKHRKALTANTPNHHT